MDQIQIFPAAHTISHFQQQLFLMLEIFKATETGEQLALLGCGKTAGPKYKCRADLATTTIPTISRSFLMGVRKRGSKLFNYLD